MPITIGTLHIDLIIEKATKEELDKISIARGGGVNYFDRSRQGKYN